MLGLAIVIARLPPPRLTAGGVELATAREVATYVLTAQPVRIPIPAGQRLLRVLTNLDLPAGAPATGTPYLLSLRMPEDARAEIFPLLAVPARDSAGAPAAIYLGEAMVPAQTREVGLLRDRALATTLEVSLVAPAGTSADGPRASLRVLLLGDRPPWSLQDALARQAAHRWPSTSDTAHEPALSAHAWQLDLAPDEQRARLSQRWMRASAVNGTATRRLYFIARAASPPRAPRPRGTPIAAGMTVAYTVQGPGTLHLLADGPLGTNVRILDESGTERSRELTLAADHRVSLAIAAGLSTVRVQSTTSARVIAIGSAPSMLVSPAGLGTEGDRDQDQGGEVDVTPSWNRLEAVRLGATMAPRGPVSWDLLGRPLAPLRLVAWLPWDGDRQEGRTRSIDVRYRLRDGAGRTIGAGVLRGEVTSAPEDRSFDDSPRALSTSIAGVLWPPARSARLELEADHETLVTVSSPGHPPAPDPEGRPALVRLLHAPAERPRWYRVDPDLGADPGADQRAAQLAFPQRLERQPAPGLPAPGESMAARGDRPQVALLVPAPPGWLGPSAFWPLATGHATAVRAGARDESGVEAAPAKGTLLYTTRRGSSHSVAGRSATLTIDGRRGGALRLFSGRGQLPLPPLSAGHHQLRIDAPSELQLFVDLPVAGARGLRRISAYRLAPARTIETRWSAGASPSTPSSFGVAVYSEGPVGPGARLELRIDGGRPAIVPGVLTATHTDGTRVVPLAFAHVPAALMLGRQGDSIWSAPPVIVPMAADLRPGRHRVSIVMRGAARAVLVRLFRLGAPAPQPPMVRFIPLRTAVNP